jgi:hypothetical protein
MLQGLDLCVESSDLRIEGCDLLLEVLDHLGLFAGVYGDRH